MTRLVDRKRFELEAKGAALAAEFQHWVEITEAGRRFEKHKSQVRRITARLGGALKKIAAEIKALSDDELLTRGVQMEQKLLAVHLVWEFFRSRIALRADDYLQRYLSACDEFAWRCWEPFLRRTGAARPTTVAPDASSGVPRQPVVKEPPLVFLNGGWSPFAVSRDLSFRMDRPGFAVDREAVAWLNTDDFGGLIEKLPVPMIGVPWFQVNHLPDALVLGHEMGHVVETDFGLSAGLEGAIAALDIKRRAAWYEWRRETFADIFGCLAGGPAFVSTLTDFLATDPAKVSQENRSEPWGLYPSRWMRVALSAEALRQTGFAVEGNTAEETWRLQYGEPSQNVDFKSDIPLVVGAVLAGPYKPIEVAGSARLTDVLSYRKDAKGRPIDRALVEVIKGRGSAGLGYANEYVAAARTLFEQDPAAYGKSTYGETICRIIEEVAPPGTRGTPGADLDAVLAADERDGEMDDL